LLSPKKKRLHNRKALPFYQLYLLSDTFAQ
jgi:hypothetical protein